MPPPVQVNGSLSSQISATLAKAGRRGAGSGPLSERRPGKKRNGTAAPTGQLTAQDIIQWFQSMPVPNRGYRNPNAAQPAKMGGGLDWMDKNNSADQVAARQGRVNAEHAQNRSNAFAAGQSAVAERKALQAMPKEPPTSAYGRGSVEWIPKGQPMPRGTTTDPVTGKQTFLDEYLPQLAQVQATKGPRDASGRPTITNAGENYFNPDPRVTAPGSIPKAQPVARTQPPAPAPSQSDFSSIFPGNSAPPPSSPQAPTPPEDPFMTQGTMEGSLPPSFRSNGMPLPPLPNDTPAAWGAQSRAQSFPAGSMTSYTPPYSSPEQLSALKALNSMFGNQSPASAGLESYWTNIFPGVNDWEHLSQLFPGVVKQGAGAPQNMRGLQNLYKDPTYQSRF